MARGQPKPDPIPDTVQVPFDKGRWTGATRDALRTLWLADYSTSQIGERLGFTKNAVVGKARRLGLPPRSSPIRGRPADWTPRPKRVAGPTLPPLPSQAEVVPEISDPTPAPAAPEPSGQQRHVFTPADQIRSALARTVRPGPTLPPLGDDRRMILRTEVRSEPRLFVPPRPAAEAPQYKGRVMECQWPIGTPRTPGFRMCEAPSEPGAPYCPKHRQIAWRRGPSTSGAEGGSASEDFVS